MTESSKKILVVAAHPDDEVLGCGGTIARLAQEGFDVYIVIMGEGITSRSRQPAEANQADIQTLHGQSREVTRMLGAKEVFLQTLPDNRFDTVPLLDIVKIVEDFVVRLSPEVVYTHHSGDLNVDHSIIHRAVLTATRPVQGQAVKELYTFEVPSSTEWAFQCFEPSFHPNVFVGISDTLEIKVQAFSQYKSEIRPFPHPRSPEAVCALAKHWGTVVGCAAAEAFELIRSIR